MNTKNSTITAGIVLVLIVFFVMRPTTIAPGKNDRGTTAKAAHLTELIIAQKECPLLYEAVGTVTSVDKSVLSSRVFGTVLQLKVSEGEAVKKGMLLAELKVAENNARLTQARHALSSARAIAVQANKAYKRTLELHNAQAATTQMLEHTKAAKTRADAEVGRASAMVAEAKTFVDYAKIKAPFDGIIEKRHLEVGDMVLPGAPLLTIYNPRKMRLDVTVKESLLAQIKKGETISAVIGSVRTGALITEIVSAADPKTRTFIVKASLDQSEGLYPGLYGSLFFTTGTRKAIEIPHQAVSQVGQLQSVYRKKADSSWARIIITLGKTEGDRVEVLSGLRSGDVIGY